MRYREVPGKYRLAESQGSRDGFCKGLERTFGAACVDCATKASRGCRSLGPGHRFGVLPRV